MRVINLASGSEGNLTYIESESAKVLIDAGLSCREIEARLSLLNVTGSQIDAILITHEHSDHIKGINIFASKFNTKIYAHADGWEILSEKLNRINDLQKHSFTSSFEIKDLSITGFKIPHDSVCCVGYSIESENKKVSLVTDLGSTHPEIIKNIIGSQLVYLEANHDETLLKNNIKYCASLKRRILSKNGHLSNTASAEIICLLAQNGTRQVVLSHLSKENNDPFLAYSTVKEYLASKGLIEGENIKVDVATHMPGKIYKIS